MTEARKKGNKCTVVLVSDELWVVHHVSLTFLVLMLITVVILSSPHVALCGANVYCAVLLGVALTIQYIKEHEYFILN